MTSDCSICKAHLGEEHLQINSMCIDCLVDKWGEIVEKSPMVSSQTLYKEVEPTTYYFISYQWKRIVLGTSNSSTWRIEREVINIHPVKWLCDTRNKYGEQVEHGKHVRYDYDLLGWNEIPKDVYDTYEGELG